MTRPDRFPPLPPEQLTADQQAAVDELVASPRGGVIGPFIATLRSPELTRRLQRLGEYLRYNAALPEKLREMAILLTAREWKQGFEWDVHAPLAAQAGLSDTVIAAIAHGHAASSMGPDELLVYSVFTELHRTRAVTDATYGAACRQFGEQGVIDLVALIGYYTTLAMIMNVAQTPSTTRFD
ncbi:MAG TPA: carboxymuconolactone decarboxylase family protein [Vicinamibacterales bacterium]|nr:carboxymuconolactone decarboxylase family protein [Vicinamibacterales bacterium]